MSVSSKSVELLNKEGSQDSVVEIENPLQFQHLKLKTRSATDCEVTDNSKPNADRQILRKSYVHEEYSLLSAIWKNSFPFRIIAVSFCFSSVYLIIPEGDYWVYNLIKQQWWSVLNLIAYIELQDACMPDFPDHLYVICYIVGFWMPILVNVIGYFCQPPSYRNVQLVAVTSGFIAAFIFYGIHSLYYPAGEHYDGMISSPSFHVSTAEDYESATLAKHPGRPQWVQAILHNDLTGTLYDTYAACIVERDDGEQRLSTPRNSHQFASHNRPSAASNDIEGRQSMKGCFADESEQDMSMDTASDGRKNFLAVQAHYHRCLFDVGVSNHQEGTVAEAIGIEGLHGEGSEQKKPTVATGPAAVQLDPPRFVWDINGWFQYSCRYLPRFYYRRLHIPAGLIFGDRRVQWFYISLYNVLFNGFFYFVALFTDYFRAHGQSTSFLMLYFYFLLGSTLLRGAMKRTAMVLDRRKLGSVSMFFIAEFMGLMFYYSYYRLLFESIDSWSNFFSFQCLHICSEWILYPMRCSSWLADQLVVCQRTFATCMGTVLIPKRTNPQDWLQFVALDFGLRVVVLVCSALGILLLTLTIDYVPWIESDLKQHGRTVAVSSEFICTAVGIEIVNAIVINQVFFAPKNVDVWRKMQRFFRHPRVTILVWVTGSLLFINPMYSFTRNNNHLTT